MTFRIHPDSNIERHEAKYLIPESWVQPIRDFIRPFCRADAFGEGDPPEYIVNTLQLDSHGMPLHYAKERESVNRYKLRVRTYGRSPGEAPVFAETKRKIGGMVVKTRTVIPFDRWSEQLVTESRLPPIFRSDAEAHAFIDFKRLVTMTGATPKIQLRYSRESYFGDSDRYSRVTFDRRLEYQTTRCWDDWGRSGRWLTMDSCVQQNQQLPFSAVILELKTLCDAPRWMVDLVRHFDLVRSGNCKYATAVWNEAVYQGMEAPFLDGIWDL